MKQQPVKIQFAFHSYLLDKWTVETMWTDPVAERPDHYRLLSIPFYATGVALHDEVRAIYSQEAGMPVFQEVTLPSGHSTVQVVRMESSMDMNPILHQLQQAGCTWEGFSDSYYVVDIPANVYYIPIRVRLAEWQTQGALDYAEASLSVGHYYEV
jgi:hypothetical protein